MKRYTLTVTDYRDDDMTGELMRDFARAVVRTGIRMRLTCDGQVLDSQKRDKEEVRP